MTWRFQAQLPFVICVSLIFGCSGADQADNKATKDNAQGDKNKLADDQADAELKWARAITEDFLRDVAKGNWNGAILQFSTEIKKRDPVGTGFNQLFGALNGRLNGGYDPDQEFHSWNINNQLLNPQRDEASFRGNLKGPQRIATFAIRVSKEKESGKWRVGYYSFEITAK